MRLGEREGEWMERVEGGERGREEGVEKGERGGEWREGCEGRVRRKRV